MRYGLRPRLLAALVLTAVVTLIAAAVALFGPLQDRLREQTASSFRAAVLAARPGLERDLRDNTVFPNTGTLERRTGSRVIVYDTVPAEVYPIPEGESEPRGADVIRSLVQDRTVQTTSEDEVSVVMTLKDRGRLRGVAAARKPTTDVSETVDRVRGAFLTAAGIGIVVAFVLGTGLSGTLTRRLGRLREAAIRTTEGLDPDIPDDDAQDEVGDLARALATMHRSLQRQEAARRQFVATASHELRTPLTLLQGMLELLDDDLEEGRVDLEDAHQQISGAQKQLRRLEHLASDLLDLSRLDAEAPLRSEPLELGEMARAVAAEFGMRATDRGLSIDVVPPIAPCWAKGDPGAVARIVRILLDNALRFAPADEPVRVATAYHGERATVEVSDAGPGVPRDERDVIFERFRRGSSTGGEEGFGLGLAIGRELAERLGGHLELVDDGRPGATFVLSLPVELPAGSREPEPVA